MVEHLIINAENEEAVDDSVSELPGQISNGWNIDDFSQIVSKAQSLKAKKTAARIKAVAKITFFAKQLGHEKESTAKMLFALNPSVKLIRENQDYIVVRVASNFRLPKLPAGYGFKGGAARLALAHVIGRDTKRKNARDFDLVRFSKGSKKNDSQLAKRIMPEDFSHGHGVEEVLSIEEYFKSRDLRINEVMLVGKKLIFTKNALISMKNGLLDFGGNYAQDPKNVPGKIVCKVLRLAAELSCAGLDYKLPIIPGSVQITNSDFEMHRSRALEVGNNVEKKYLELCEEFGIVINKNIKTAVIPSAKPILQASRSLVLRNELRKHRKHF